MANSVYEVLSPWAEADPVAPRGINPFPESLEGKTIGLLRNSKRAAEPSLKVVEARLKERYPTATFSWFDNLKPNETLVAQGRKDEFEAWLKGVDAVISSYGD
jgi:hypothetical protein